MTELFPGVHLEDGVDPSPDFTTHVFLLKNRGGGYTLVDTGVSGKDAAILAYLKSHAIAPAEVKHVLITHLHADHTGNLRRILDVTKAKSYAHWIEAGFIAQRPAYDGPGSPPKEPVEIDVRFKDGDVFEMGEGLVAYHTPGHTPGHTSYFEPSRGLLFSGDLFFGIPELALTLPDYTIHTGTAQISARRMADLSPQALLTYHGGPFLKGSAEALRSLVRQF
ncbi:MAG: MBL fold metallo-hydrolase [Thermoplasmata archaeon]|nr:MBL fold metallo-hydrolase [Thermoplasmata archaeon]